MKLWWILIMKFKQQILSIFYYIFKNVSEMNSTPEGLCFYTLANFCNRFFFFTLRGRCTQTLISSNQYILLKRTGGAIFSPLCSKMFQNIFSWLFSEIFLFMFNWTQKIAKNLPWYKVSINKVCNDKFKIEFWLSYFKRWTMSNL